METSIVLLLSVFNVTSSFLAAITAYLYFWLPNVQNSHGTCVFHFSLNITLMHAVLILYKITTGVSLFFRQYCMTEVYVVSFLIAAVHVWSVILSYNTWKEIEQIRVVSKMYPKRRLNWYRFLGYGISMLYVVLMICIRIMSGNFIFYHPGSLLVALEDCSLEIEYGGVFHSFGSILLNVFFFADSRRRLSKLSFSDITRIQNENSLSESSMTSVTKLKYKMFLNLKLCLTMNIPFGLSSIIFVIVASFSNRFNLLLDLLLNINFFLASLQGTFIFLVAVAFRKLVIKSFIKHRDKSCVGCIWIPECLMRPSANDDTVETTDGGVRRHSEKEAEDAPS